MIAVMNSSARMETMSGLFETYKPNPNPKAKGGSDSQTQTPTPTHKPHPDNPF